MREDIRSARCVGSTERDAGARGTLVLGLGNPILGDDGAGRCVAREVDRRLGNSRQGIEVDCLDAGGLALMERLAGYRRVILIDAISGDPEGAVVRLGLDDLRRLGAGHSTSPHDATLQDAVALGQSVGVEIPRAIEIVGLVTRKVFDVSEDLSGPVARAVPRAAALVLEMLDETKEG